MALKNRSLILYGLQVTEANRSIDFLNVALGTELHATLTLGFYSLTSILVEVERAMNAADPSNTYTATANRTIAGGSQNRVTISTSGSFLSLLFSSGSRNASSAGPLLGFTGDQTGSTSYQGTATCGTALIPEEVGYNYLGPDFYKKVQGSLSITASGDKEAIVFQIMRFIKVQYKYEPESKVSTEWMPFWNWAIQQRVFDFTPDYVLFPSIFYQVTVEKTPDASNGLGFSMKEMLPQFPFEYDTGLLELRVKDT